MVLKYPFQTWSIMRQILVVALLLLAGCTSPSAEEDGAEPVREITDPRDTSYLADPDQVEHVHNYWGGQDSVTVLDVESAGTSLCQECPPEGMGFSWQRPDEGRIVPQGTAWINGTITLQESGENTYDGLDLWIKTASDSELRRWGSVESGVPFSVNTTQETNDPPHYVLSLWQFQLRALGGNEIQVSGTTTWNVQAVRGLPLVPYPAHPDRWQDKTELDLLSEETTAHVVHQQVPFDSYSCYAGCLGTHTLPDGVVVPFETTEVLVTLTITDGIPAGIGLWFHGADSWELVKPEGQSETQGSWLYTIPLDGPMADSPYAPQSLWEFIVELDQPQPAVQTWKGDYEITVVAVKG